MRQETIDAVNRGIALLDEKAPGWRGKIKPENLDLADCRYCVLGQVFKHYSSGLFKLFHEMIEATSETYTETSVWYGFNTADGYDRFEELEQAWLEKLK